MLKMRPDLCARMTGKTARVTRIRPKKIRFKNFPNRLFAAFLKGGDGTESRIVHQHINAAELLNSSRCSLVVDGLIRIRDVKRQMQEF